MILNVVSDLPFENSIIAADFLDAARPEEIVFGPGMTSQPSTWRVP